MSDVSGIALNSFIDGTFLEAAGAVSKNSWEISLPSATATVSDL